MIISMAFDEGTELREAAGLIIKEAPLSKLSNRSVEMLYQKLIGELAKLFIETADPMLVQETIGTLLDGPLDRLSQLSSRSGSYWTTALDTLQLISTKTGSYCQKMVRDFIETVSVK